MKKKKETINEKAGAVHRNLIIPQLFSRDMVRNLVGGMK
jgi:hypothetical protein